MKFDLSLDNISEPIQKEYVLSKNKSIIKELKQHMFDLYNVDEIFLDQEFYNADVAFSESIPVIIPMKYKSFCKLVDNKEIEFSNSINYIIETEEEFYSLDKNNVWRKSSRNFTKMKSL